MRRLIMTAGFAFFSGVLLGQARGGMGSAHGGFAGAPTNRISSAPAGHPPASGGRISSSSARATVRPNTQGSSGGSWTSAGFIPNHSQYGNGYAPGARRKRVSYGYPGILGYPFGYPGYYGGFGFDDNDGNDPNQQANAAANGYAASGDPDPEGYQGRADFPYADDPTDRARPAYRGRTGPAVSDESRTSVVSSDGLEHPKVILVFKDGHTLKIQNYAATRSKIFVRDTGAERDIPIASLDISATLAANEDAGVEFSLPGQ